MDGLPLGYGRMRLGQLAKYFVPKSDIVTSH
jgi:hypothetical protein